MGKWKFSQHWTRWFPKHSARLLVLKTSCWPWVVLRQFKRYGFLYIWYKLSKMWHCLLYKCAPTKALFILHECPFQWYFITSVLSDTCALDTGESVSVFRGDVVEWLLWLQWSHPSLMNECSFALFGRGGWWFDTKTDGLTDCQLLALRFQRDDGATGFKSFNPRPITFVFTYVGKIWFIDLCVATDGFSSAYFMGLFWHWEWAGIAQSV